MGYYDQDYKEKPRKQKGNRSGWAISALVGAILGALLIVFSIPALLQWDVLPYDLSIPEEQVMEVPKEEPGNFQQNVQVNVTSQITEVVDLVSDAVVGVINIQQSGFWSDQTSEAGTGSGVIYKRENGNAFIVTNHHVIEGANEVEVSLSDGTRIPADILGSDVFTDLAVLRVDSAKIDTIADFGNSDTLRPGEPVIAIGNPLGLQFSGSVTQGIISGTDRTIPIDINRDGRPDWQAEVLQTDAAINPGNSGGALINIQGKVIGINSMKIAQQAVEGIGLAIPINSAQPIISDLEKFGEVRRPFMGIGSRSLSEVSSYHWHETLKLPEKVTAGVFIVSVVPLSPADQAGLQELDVIVKMDSQPIEDIIDLRKYLYSKKDIGDPLEITFYRQGEKMTTTMKLAEEKTY
jgi:serine protease Do